MVDFATVRESDLDEFRRLHNRYVDRDESLATVRSWYEDHPDLLVGAYRDGELVGHCLGLPRSEGTVELAGIAVEPAHRRRGVGTRLLTAFENRASSLGFDRVTLGSAGGYVDEFYRENGYAPESVLVRLDPGDLPDDDRESDYAISEEAVENGTKKLYVEVEEFDPATLDEVRDAFGDPEAIYVVEKRLADST